MRMAALASALTRATVSVLHWDDARPLPASPSDQHYRRDSRELPVFAPATSPNGAVDMLDQLLQ